MDPIYKKYPGFIELMDCIKNTPEGKDFSEVLFKNRIKITGYELRKPGRLYLDCGSYTYIHKSEGLWHYTSISNGIPFDGEIFKGTIPEMLRFLWIKIILKRTPVGCEKIKFRKWLESKECKLYGKAYSINEIIRIYYQSNKCYYIKDENSLFISTKWKMIFSVLGAEKIILPDLRIRDTLCIKFLKINDPNTPSSFWRDLMVKFFGCDLDLLEKDLKSNLSFCINSTMTDTIAKWRKIRICSSGQEEMENSIIEMIIKQIKYYPPCRIQYKDNLPAQLMVYILSEGKDSENINEMNRLILENPVILLSISDPLRARIMEENNISPDLLDTIDYAHRFKLL